MDQLRWLRWGRQEIGEKTGESGILKTSLRTRKTLKKLFVVKMNFLKNKVSQVENNLFLNFSQFHKPESNQTTCI